MLLIFEFINYYISTVINMGPSMIHAIAIVMFNHVLCNVLMHVKFSFQAFWSVAFQMTPPQKLFKLLVLASFLVESYTFIMISSHIL